MTMSSRTLSEAESKNILTSFGIPFAQEREVRTASQAVEAAAEVNFPVAIKLCGDNIAHKSERGLLRLGVRTAVDAERAAQELLDAALPEDGEVTLLVARMIDGKREFIAGMVNDLQFGPCIMLGVGGILAEAVADVVFRPVPLSIDSAISMIDGLKTKKLLGSFRGEDPVDRKALASVLVGLSRAYESDPSISSIDVNPVIIRSDGSPVAVDALVEVGLESKSSVPSTTVPSTTARYTAESFSALFDPKGILVAGASTHPGKFGFVSLHNILASGYRGSIGGTNLQGETVLGIETVASASDIPDGVYDMVLVCTPASSNIELLKQCAAKGIRAAFVTSAGYGEAGEAGLAAEQELVATAQQLGILLAGPNGQGVVSTPSRMCAQIVAPYPPTGRIGVASQSGNFVSSFLNWSRATGIGISRAVSAGNAAAVGVADYLDFFASDSHTDVGLAYIEGIVDGRELMSRLSKVSQDKPLVLLKGGSSEIGARAAASHTGALAANDKVFDGFCSAAGITRARTVEEAFEAAATFATQPLPQGPNVVILTTAGGWGVVTSDAIEAEGDLNLIELPADLRSSIDELLPPRWSRSNPIDCAGGETRDTIPTILDLVSSHPEVHSVIYLGIGIQSNQARLMREGGYFPDHGIDRIVAYHERQDQRFAEAADEFSKKSGKPILVASELAVADPDNPGPATVRATGRMCYPSGNRAVVSLAHLYRYRRYLESRGLDT
jgi:acetyltransferase